MAVGTVNLRNTTIAGNTASVGGGGADVTRSQKADLSFHNGTLGILAATIALNTAPAGAGVLVDNGAFSLRNGLVVGNVAGGDWTGSTLTGAVNSLVGIPGGQVLADILHGGLADHGGPTQTIALTRASTNLALGRGNAALCASTTIGGIDQRGVARPTLCDVGAFELENVLPTTSTPRTALRSGATLSGTATPVRISWTGSDGSRGSGIVRFVLSRSVNGGAWTTISGLLTGTSFNTVLANGKAYRFRVRAVDRDGNTGAWKTGPSATPRLVQQTSSSIRYVKTWATTTSAVYSGGTARSSSVAGASATFTFTGRAVALIASTGPNRGRAKVYVNGALVTTIDLSLTAPANRVLVWQRWWSTSATRVVKVVVLGTTGRPRVDVDAFEVLR
jgi:hypothetical protein